MMFSYRTSVAGRRMALALAIFAVLAPGGAPAADIFAGRTVYEAHCANCHGLDGFPVMPGTPDFTRGEGLMAPDIQLLEPLRRGRELMPGFDHIISDRDMLNVLAYSRTLQR